ncbi:WYL domain-containing protein [Campylobacter sp. RM12640]|uniref:hypothetical protein n=1 Tax=unclassified Campylobacter TaxID=2593542 RepID=UPI0030149C2B|nr:WYL domain-containing protein [Campylobacter sp. RM12640]MBZ7989557.1 WYL domain-containing protein [Campylobacter sp. RM12635]
MKVDNKDLMLIDLIYEKISSKDELAKALNVSTKTIENRTKNLSLILRYSKRLEGYIFTDLLPKYISPKVVFKHIFAELENANLESEFKGLFNEYFCSQEKLIDTSKLSNLNQKIIMLNHAINHNILLSCEYKNERKIIQANQLKVSNSKRYLYITYDKKNGENVGEYRTFALNSMKDIIALEYVKNGGFKNTKSGNAFGYAEGKKSVILYLKNEAASFFKREKPKSHNFRFLSEDDNGIEIEFFYSPSSVELESFIASWLPLISIKNDDELAQKIYENIQNNLNELRNLK